MATTTNYGWTTPDDTALVKDGASAIRSLGTSVDTTTKNLNPSTTLGDIEYRSSTANTNTRLGIGTTGQLLTVVAGVPSWSNAPSSSPASAVASVATRQSTSSTSYTDLTTSGPAVTLTTGTKVLVIVSAAIDQNGADDRPGYMDFAVSGATTRAASDTTALIGAGNSSFPSTNANRNSSAQSITVTAGSNTFTAKYHGTSSNTVFFTNRTITVIDLGS